jgi:hypothetical protein
MSPNDEAIAALAAVRVAARRLTAVQRAGLRVELEHLARELTPRAGHLPIVPASEEESVVGRDRRGVRCGRCATA